MKLKHILSLSPVDIQSFLRKHPNKDLPLIIHYWKWGLLSDYTTEKKLYEYILDYGNNYDETRSLIKGLLGSELLKNISLERDPLAIVLKSYLILENFIDNIMEEKSISFKKLSFYSKVELLNKRSLLEEDVYNDLILLNKLRNEYAHNYYFDIGGYDMSSFSICHNLYEGLPIKKNSTRAVLNIKVFQFFVLYHLLGRISYDFPFLNKVKIGKMPNKVFYKERFGNIVGELISKTDRIIENSDLGLEIQINVFKKEEGSTETHRIKIHYPKD